MNRQSDFFLYLIERYAAYKATTADKVLADWTRLDVVDMIYDMYDIYHCERLENAFEDIDSMIEEHRLRNQ